MYILRGLLKSYIPIKPRFFKILICPFAAFLYN
jgi:hypothetical protein